MVEWDYWDDMAHTIDTIRLALCCQSLECHEYSHCITQLNCREQNVVEM